MKKLNILIIEDDDDHAFLESDILMDELDCQVEVVPDLAKFKAVDLKDKDVILLDFNLPDTNGSEILHMIRKHSDIPVIVITGRKEMKVAIDTLKEGANDFLEKSPFNISTLPSTVERVYEAYLKKKKLETEIKEKEQIEVKIETLRQLLTTLAHYINNSTTTISGYAQLASQNRDDSIKIDKLIRVCLRETKKITIVLKELEQFVKDTEIKTASYVDIPDAMFSIEENLDKKMKEIEEQKLL